MKGLGMVTWSYLSQEETIRWSQFLVETWVKDVIFLKTNFLHEKFPTHTKIPII